MFPCRNQRSGVLYQPVMQSRRSPLTFVAKSPLDPLSLVPAVRAKLKARDSARALGKVWPMARYVERSVAPAGFTAALPGAMTDLNLKRLGLDLPIPVEIKCGRSWGELAAWEGTRDG